MKKHGTPITHIVLHHSATRVLPLREALEAFRKSHLSRGWLDIGYHYLVHPDPSEGWCVGRDPKYVGSHVKGMNSGKIGICLIGDYPHLPGEEETLPFWFWHAISNIHANIRMRHILNELELGDWKYTTHHDLLPHHTECGKGVIQRLAKELNEYHGR